MRMSQEISLTKSGGQLLFSKAADLENNIPACYFAVCLACAGLYPITPGANAWTVNNLAGPMKRAQGVAYMIMMGNIGGIIGMPG